MLSGGKISAADLDLMVVTGSPQEARDLILEAMINGGWYQQKEEVAREETRKAYQKKDKDHQKG